MDPNTKIDQMRTLVATAEAFLADDLTSCSDEQVTELLLLQEKLTRMLCGTGSHLLIHELGVRGIPEQAGLHTMGKYLIAALGLSVTDANQRVGAARDFGRVRQVDGQETEPRYAHTAAGQATGEIGVEQAHRVALIMKKLPHSLGLEVHEAAEATLAAAAASCTPEDLIRVGAELLARLDPDGSLSDERDRKRRRGISIGEQKDDLMSRVSGWIDPELRAYLDAVLAKWARPGANNPDDPDSPHGDVEDPHLDRKKLVDAATRDTRSAAQRNHDALSAICRTLLGSGLLGEHRGVPVTAILTMGIRDLEAAAGVATTATGGIVPIANALRMAEHSHLWLCLFDDHGRPLYLGRSARLANVYQRLALYATSRGCTKPGCDAPASMTQVHHLTEWANNGGTDITNLDLACDGDHGLVDDTTPTGWATRRAGVGSDYPDWTEWIPPAGLDPARRPRVNLRHHVSELLARAVEMTRHRHDAEHQAWLADRYGRWTNTPNGAASGTAAPSDAAPDTATPSDAAAPDTAAPDTAALGRAARAGAAMGDRVPHASAESQGGGDTDRTPRSGARRARVGGSLLDGLDLEAATDGRLRPVVRINHWRWTADDQAA